MRWNIAYFLGVHIDPLIPFDPFSYLLSMFHFGCIGALVSLLPLILVWINSFGCSFMGAVVLLHHITLARRVHPIVGVFRQSTKQGASPHALVLFRDLKIRKPIDGGVGKLKWLFSHPFFT